MKSYFKGFPRAIKVLMRIVLSSPWLTPQRNNSSSIIHTEQKVTKDTRSVCGWMTEWNEWTDFLPPLLGCWQTDRTVWDEMTIQYSEKKC